MEIAVHIYRLKALKVPGQKETVNTTQRIFLPQEKPFLHKASPQVLEAGPPEGQLRAQPSGHSIFQRTLIKGLLSSRCAPGARATAEGKTARPYPQAAYILGGGKAKRKTN